MTSTVLELGQIPVPPGSRITVERPDGAVEVYEENLITPPEAVIEEVIVVKKHKKNKAKKRPAPMVRRWRRVKSWTKKTRKNITGRARRVSSKSGRRIKDTYRGSKRLFRRIGHRITSSSHKWAARSKAGARTSWRAVKRAGWWTLNKLYRGIGYVGYGLATAYAWFYRALDTSLVVTVSAVALVGAVALALVRSAERGERKDARFFRWMSKGKSVRKYKSKKLKKEARKGRKQRHRVAQTFSRAVTDEPVMVAVPVAKKAKVKKVDDSEYSALEEGLSEDDDYTPPRGAGLTEAHVGTDTERMDEYGGMTTEEILDRHRRRIAWLKQADPDEYKTDISYWEGRVLLLEKFIEDPESLPRMESFYQEWKSRHPKKGNQGGPHRGEFHKGMVEERKRLREAIENHELRILISEATQ